MDTQRITLKNLLQVVQRRENLLMKRRLLVLSALVSLAAGIKYVLIDRPDEIALLVVWMFGTMTLALFAGRETRLISQCEPLDRYRLYVKDE